MIKEMWKCICVSVLGTSHAESGIPCQDNSSYEIINDAQGSSVLVAVLSDGAGSASRADIGSSFACSSFICEIKTLIESGGQLQDISRDFVVAWLKNFQSDIYIRSEEEGLKKSDFACTFLAAVIGENNAIFAQVGDGAIVVLSSDEANEYSWIFWPQHGEYVNETYFVTDEIATSKLEYAFVEHRVDEAALFTDGIENLVLNNKTQSVHSPFFNQWFDWLRRVPNAVIDKANHAVEAYLNSAKINECTSDDKSLILATRKPQIIQE